MILHPTDDFNPGRRVNHLRGYFPGAIGRIVIHDNDFNFIYSGTLDGFNRAMDQAGNVSGLIQGRHDH